MRGKFRNTQENTMYHNEKVLLVKCFNNSPSDKRKFKKRLILCLNFKKSYRIYSV